MTHSSSPHPSIPRRTFIKRTTGTVLFFGLGVAAHAAPGTFDCTVGSGTIECNSDSADCFKTAGVWPAACGTPSPGNGQTTVGCTIVTNKVGCEDSTVDPGQPFTHWFYM